MDHYCFCSQICLNCLLGLFLISYYWINDSRLSSWMGDTICVFLSLRDFHILSVCFNSILGWTFYCFSPSHSVCGFYCNPFIFLSQVQTTRDCWECIHTHFQNSPTICSHWCVLSWCCSIRGRFCCRGVSRHCKLFIFHWFCLCLMSVCTVIWLPGWWFTIVIMLFYQVIQTI